MVLDAPLHAISLTVAAFEAAADVAKYLEETGEADIAVQRAPAIDTLLKLFHIEAGALFRDVNTLVNMKSLAVCLAIEFVNHCVFLNVTSIPAHKDPEYAEDSYYQASKIADELSEVDSAEP